MQKVVRNFFVLCLLGFSELTIDIQITELKIQLTKSLCGGSSYVYTIYTKGDIICQSEKAQQF